MGPNNCPLSANVQPPDYSPVEIDRNAAASLALLERLGRAMQARNRAEIVEIVAGLADLKAPVGEQWRQLAMLAAEYGELDLARRALDLFVDMAHGKDAARYQKATALFDFGLVAEAYAEICSLPPDRPDPLANAFSRGVGALYLGRPMEARPLLERVAAACPQSGSTWLALASMGDLTRGRTLLARLVAAEPAMQAAPAAERASFYYALGKLHADRDEHDRAFAAFARGASETRPIVVYDRARDAVHAEGAMRGFTAARIAASGCHRAESTERTIFVTGLPRSGTTLVEQILASHSMVAGGGELKRLSLLAHEAGGRDWEAVERLFATGRAGELARLWQRWIGQRFPGRGRVVDKSLDAGRYLGLVAMVLPEAPLIHVTRDPLDRAWSCFRTHFEGAALPWSYDLRDIAAHLSIEKRLFDHWAKVLGGRLLVVRYEDLVGDPVHWTKKILAHCGLPEEAQVFKPHKVRRAVITASTMQVRQPIHSGAVGAARPYRRHIAPLIEAFASGA